MSVARGLNINYVIEIRKLGSCKDLVKLNVFSNFKSV